MIDYNSREGRQYARERNRRRMHASVDPENYEYFPATKSADFYDENLPRRVAIYARVSTDDPTQTTSFELQKKYYDDYVKKMSNWTLVDIYADEGKSGTTTKHRDEFNRMIADAKAGKFDSIITKSVSRFARDVMTTIGVVRDLAKLKNPVGVFFQSECIFSLNDESQMALTFQATMAEEESHIRSRSMETSLRMRLDNGIPLTPKLLGYTHDKDGNLIINEDEAPTVKLAFYMYLYGYSTQQIADTLIALGCKSYLGNIKWTSTAVVSILRNERHCGEVLTRKTMTPNFRDHRSVKNRGERPQSLYKNHHEPIVSKDDFIAVQRMLDNAKYRNKSFLPQLKVIKEGLLKGYVIINPRWSGFKPVEYVQASASAYTTEEYEKFINNQPEEVSVEVSAGDFDMRGFEVTRSELFNSINYPTISFTENKVRLSIVCIKKLEKNNYIELLVNPVERKIAIRATTKENKNALKCSKANHSGYAPREMPSTAFQETIYSIFDWNTDYKFRVTGTFFEQDGEMVYIFNTNDAEAFFKSNTLSDSVDISQMKPLTTSGKRIGAIPKSWINSFGYAYYSQEQTLQQLARQSEADWNLRMEGQLYNVGCVLKVTPFNELRSYITSRINGIMETIQ